MSDKDASTPRVYLARHGTTSQPTSSLKEKKNLLTFPTPGETEWTKNGRYTGTTELSLTENGVQQVLATGKILVGPGRLISPARLAHIFISPRLRAQQTFSLLFSSSLPEGDQEFLTKEGKVSTTDALAEWDYGAYEGLLTKEIRAGRKERGLDAEREWDIWRDGCEGGEEPMQVMERLDGLVREIREIQGPWMHGGKGVDVLLVCVFLSIDQLIIKSSGWEMSASFCNEGRC